MKSPEITDIVLKICDILDVPYSHYDFRNLPTDYFHFIKLDKKPLVIIYPEPDGHWIAAILEDGEVITPAYNAMQLREKLLATLTPEMKESLGEAGRPDSYQFILDEAKRWLVENDHVSKLRTVLK